MYVCMCIYVWLHECIDGCMYVCMFVCMYACIYVWLNVCIDGCMHVCLYACMLVYICACSYACLYVCTCLYAMKYIQYMENLCLVDASCCNHCICWVRTSKDCKVLLACNLLDYKERKLATHSLLKGKHLSPLLELADTSYLCIRNAFC